MQSDIQIAQKATLKPIQEIAGSLGIGEESFQLFGKHKAKVNHNILKKLSKKKDGDLILVTAMNPTPAGEGKTTTTVGLGDALSKMGSRSIIAIREPSLGPVFGIKGGAAGGGHAQVVPMEDINLHFTGDIHAVGAANNLLAAIIDNHIYRGNKLDIDTRRITWKRCMDMNDRQLRNIVIGLSGKSNGIPREDGFDITVASEVMAILCMSLDLNELKNRLKNIVIGYTFKGKPVIAGQLKAEGAMAALLKDALNPNLVQTLEHTPAFIHGGPFANIAHGCNSIIATKTALKLADTVVTEAGFGADLGAEKFINIKCRAAGIKPSAVVIVSSVRALKLHGGLNRKDLSVENFDALKMGMCNLYKHIENITEKFGLSAVIAINRFPTDTQAELEYVKTKCDEYNVPAATSNVWAKGSKGGTELAEKVLKVVKNKNNSFKFTYSIDMPVKDKIKNIVKEIYGGKDVKYTGSAIRDIKKLERYGYGKLPVCMAKTQYSLSDNPKLTGRPEKFTITVKSVKVSAGAGFLVVFTGNIMTMPGLPKNPSAEDIDIDKQGEITGLF